MKLLQYGFTRLNYFTKSNKNMRELMLKVQLPPNLKRV